MKRSSLLKLNKMIWALAGVVAVLSLVIVSLFLAQSAAEPTSKAPSPPTIEAAPVPKRSRGPDSTRFNLPVELVLIPVT
jgi:hypothetical protein